MWDSDLRKKPAYTDIRSSILLLEIITYTTLSQERSCSARWSMQMYTIAIALGLQILLGTCQENLYTMSYLFLHKGGVIRCVVNRYRRYQSCLAQGGMARPLLCSRRYCFQYNSINAEEGLVQFTTKVVLSPDSSHRNHGWYM